MCTPELPKSKYRILSVNSVDYKIFQKKNRDSVAASTSWGRSYRVSRLLQKKQDDQETELTLQTISGEVIKTILHWKREVPSLLSCVTSERLASDIFKVHVADLWCDESHGGSWSRKKILANFEKQFDAAMSEARPSDRIILELRENGGGGDEEVEYVLNTFFDKSVLLYHYQYLRSTHPGGLKWITKYTPFILGKWSNEEFQYTKLEHRPRKTFYTNKMAVITSAGCFSSCETIVSILKNENRAKTIGSITHGGSGDPLFFPIKETHYSINLPLCVNWQMPGVFYEGVGVRPDIIMFQKNNIEEDNILKAAIDLTL